MKAEFPNISEEDLEELAYSRVGEGFDGYTLVSPEVVISQRRWQTSYEWVIRRDADNTYWCVQQDRGSTEYQDSEPPVVICQVYPVEKTITIYQHGGV